MKSEDFIGMLGDIDSKMVEKASEDMVLWQEAQQGEVVRAGSPRKHPLRIAAASVACAAAVLGGFVLIRNIGKNGIMLEPASSYDNDVQSEDSVPADDPGTVDKVEYSKTGVRAPFEAVDPVNDLIRYVWQVEPDRISYELLNPSQVSNLVFEDSETSMRHLYESLGIKNPLDEADSPFSRCVNDGHFECDVPDGTSIVAPISGRVITVADTPDGYGKSVAVEIYRGKIFVLHHLDEVYVKVGDEVIGGQKLGLRASTDDVTEYRPKISLVIMQKVAAIPAQTFSADFEGLVLTVTTDKSYYNIGDSIYITVTLENTTDEDITLQVYDGIYRFMPHINDLINFDYQNAENVDLTLKPGEICSEEYIFQTYKGYIEVDKTNHCAYGRYDFNKPAERREYIGEISIFTGTNEEYLNGKALERSLEFSMGIGLQNSEYETPSDDSVMAETSTGTQYTEGMLKDYFIFGGVLYTNCYTCPIDWVVDSEIGGYDFDFSKIGDLFTTINGRADLQTFENNTANVLSDGTEIYTFPDWPTLLIAVSGDEYIPYMGMIEG